MFFAYDNLIDQATLTASSAATGFPANNVKNPFRSKCWQTAGATPGDATLVVDMTALWTPFTFANALTNGGFTSDTGSWTAVDSTLASVAGGQSGNGLEITRTGGVSQYAYQDITTVVGKMYKLTVYIKSGTSGNEAYRLQASKTNLTEYTRKDGTSSGSWVQDTLYFTATDTTTRIILAKITATAGTMLFDTAIVNLMIGTTDPNKGGFQAIALTGYDWTAAPATLQIEFNNTDGWTSPAKTETLTWVSPTTPGGNKGSIIKKLTQEWCFRYARLNVGTYGAPTDWNLGRLFLGPIFEPARDHGWGYGEEIVDPSLTSFTIGGQVHIDDIEKYRVLSYEGVLTTQAQWVLYQAMANEVGTRKEFFAAFDYTNEAAERTIYGRFTKLPAIKRPFLWEYEFEFTESR